MNAQKITIRVLGARGSLPISKNECIRFGGSTSSYQIITDEDDLILDGGSGIINAIPVGDTTNIVLSHLHLDHVVGLSGYTGLADPAHTTSIYIPQLDDIRGKEDMRELFNPPFWPLGLEDYPGKITLHRLPESIQFGPYSVSVSDGSHPGGCKIITILVNGKKIVYATDYEHDGKGDKALCELAANADILLYDGAYTAEEYDNFKGYGHSTPNEGIRIAREAGVRKLLITHHLIEHSDDFLEELEDELKKEFADIYFAREKDIINL